MKHSLQVYHFEPSVRCLGPGMRSVLWVQGCDIGCPGCLVPDSHDASAGETLAIAELVDRILSVPESSGLTISGGEPFQQASALLELLTQVKRKRPDFSIMVYSGYSRRRLERNPLYRHLLAAVDILVTGPYREQLPQPDGWRGSANQEIHFLTARHSAREIPAAAPDLEFVLRPDGGFFMAGIPPRGLWRRLMRQMRS